MSTKSFPCLTNSKYEICVSQMFYLLCVFQPHSVVVTLVYLFNPLNSPGLFPTLNISHLLFQVCDAIPSGQRSFSHLPSAEATAEHSKIALSKIIFWPYYLHLILICIFSYFVSKWYKFVHLVVCFLTFQLEIKFLKGKNTGTQ